MNSNLIPLKEHMRKVSVLLLLFLFTNGYHVKGQDETYPEGINMSNASNSNINNPRGTFSQDLKRSTGIYILKNENKKYSICSCNLVNTVTQKSIPYILTSAHCLDDLSVSSEHEGYFSFDFEMADANDRGHQGNDDWISGVWKATYTIVFKNDQSDLALLKLQPNTYKPELLENAYVAGWDNKIGNQFYMNISHPNEDHKKIFINPAYSYSALGTANYNNIANIVKGIFYLVNSPWDGEVTYTENGSSGSGAFSKENYLIGVLSGASIQEKLGESHVSFASALLNSWKAPSLDENQGLALYLDPNKSLLNFIPGGYLNDLVQLNEQDFFLKIEPNNLDDPIFQTPFLENPANKKKLDENIRYINASTFFIPKKLINPNPWFDIKGIKTKDFSDQSKPVLSVWYADKNETSKEYELRLLYGSYVNSETLPDRYGFAEKFWDCNKPEDFPKCNRILSGIWPLRSSGKSSAVQNRVLRYLKKLGKDRNKVMTLQNQLPIVVKLQNIGSSDAKVNAIAYPGEVPLNALQLFKPDEVKKEFNYYKYEKSKGEEQTNGYYINSIKVEFEQYIHHGQGVCVAVPKKVLQEISTGNNGGYLNLVNANYLIKNVVASEKDCDKKNTLTITINTATSDNKYYGAWLDYFRDKKDGDYTYNFKDDTTEHNVEQLCLDKTTGTITITHKIPNAEDLIFDENNTIKTQLRLAIAQEPQGENTELTQDGIYKQGEVEDYLIEIINTSKEDRANAIKATAAIHLKPSNAVKDSEETRNGYTSNHIGYYDAFTSSAAIADPDGNSITETQQAANHMQYPFGALINQGLDARANYLLTGYLENLGTAEGIFNPFLQQVQNVLNQVYAALPVNELTDLLGANALIKPTDLNPQNFVDLENPLNPGNDLVNLNNPANDFNPIGLNIPLSPPDTNPFQGSEAGILTNPNNASLFYKIYNNIARIAAYIYDPNLYTQYQNTHYSELPSDYWLIYTEYKKALENFRTGAQVYNHVILLQDVINHINEQGIPNTLKDPRFIISKVLYFLYLNPSLIINALPAGQSVQAAKTLYLFYKYFIPFYVTMRNMPWYIAQYNKAINLVENNGKIAIDFFGNLISQAYNARSILSYNAIGQYPSNTNELGVIYHAKGDDNQVVLGVDHEGYLVYRVKVGTANWQEVKSTAQIPLEDRVRIAIRFDQGAISLFLNDDEIGSGTVTNQFSDFSGFTDINNGARWGGPVTDFSGGTDTSYLVALDGALYELLVFDKAISNEEIEILGGFESLEEEPIARSAGVAKANQSKGNTGANAVTTKLDTATEESDFSIFPNPAKDQLNIFIEVAQAGALNIALFSLNGAKAYSMEEPYIRGGHQFIALKNLNLPTGNYVLKVKAGRTVKTAQVIFE